MEVENIYVPANKQEEKVNFYTRYLWDCVEAGVLSETEAMEIIREYNWSKVEKMIDWGDSREEENEEDNPLLHS